MVNCNFHNARNVVTIQNCYRSLMLDFSIVGGFVYQTLLLLLINSIYRNFYKGEAKNILYKIVFKITKKNTSTLENILSILT